MGIDKSVRACADHFCESAVSLKTMLAFYF